jgi:CheY-like chemotaxis protein
MPKVLLVNDVAIVNKIMKRKLEAEEGFFVDTALTGKEGVLKAQENSYDIFLLDFYMPDINGDEVCKAIKAGGKNPHAPIYFVSSMDKTTMAEVIQKTGAQGHIDMAMDITEFSTQLRALAKE